MHSTTRRIPGATPSPTTRGDASNPMRMTEQGTATGHRSPRQSHPEPPAEAALLIGQQLSTATSVAQHRGTGSGGLSCWPPRLVCLGVVRKARSDQSIADIRLSEDDRIDQPRDGAATEFEYSGVESLETCELPSRDTLAAIGFKQPTCLRHVPAREKALNPGFCIPAERHAGSQPNALAVNGGRERAADLLAVICHTAT